MQRVPSPDYLFIAYRDDLRMLVARWQRPVTANETKEGYHLILEAGRHFQCPFWLLDARRRLPADAETTTWGLQHFFPTLSTYLDQRVCLSHLISPTYHQATDANPAFQEAENLSTQSFRMRRFNDEAQAVQWLNECQQQSQPVMM